MLSIVSERSGPRTRFAAKLSTSAGFFPLNYPLKKCRPRPHGFSG